MKSADGGTLADYLSDFLSEDISEEDKKSVCANDKTSLKPTETAGKPLLKNVGAAKTASEENLHANHRSRMIGRFLKSPDSLNDHEILEILLYFTVKRKDTNPLAHKILSYFKDLSAVFEADADTLKKIDGVGDKIAAEFLTISQVIKRVENIKKNSDKTEFRSLRNIKPLIDETFSGATTERVALFTFDERKKFKNKIIFESDDFSKVAFDSAKVADAVAITKPKFALVAHNHPSGIAEPSNADDLATTKLEMILSLHGVTLLDHVIVGKYGETFSYFAAGRLQNIKNSCNIDRMIERSIKAED